MPKKIVAYHPGTVQKDYRVGDVIAHSVEDTAGAEKIIVPEQSIFLLESDVTAKERWEGIRLPERTYRPGDVQFLPAGTEFSTLSVSQPYSATMVRLPHRAFSDAARGVAELPVGALTYAHINDNEVSRLARLLRRTLSNDGVHPMLVEAMAMTISVGILCSFSDPVRKVFARLPDGLSRERKVRALAFIEENLHRPIQLSQIAAVAALSPCHFSRSFTASMGVGPVRYVMRRRIELARRMLATNNLPLAALALACGFSSQSHFSTAFKEHTDMTPAAFRRSML